MEQTGLGALGCFPQSFTPFLGFQALFSQLTLTPLSSLSLHRIFLNFPCFLQLLTVAVFYVCFSQVHFIHFYCFFPAFVGFPVKHLHPCKKLEETHHFF